MDEVAMGAASAVRHEDEAGARRWFEVIAEEHAALLADGSPAWDDFARRLRARASGESFDDDDVTRFVEHVEAASTSPLEVVAALADESAVDELVAAATADAPDTDGTTEPAQVIEAAGDHHTAADEAHPTLFPDAATGLLYDAAGSWYLRDGVTQVHADDSGYFYDAAGNWYLDGEPASHGATEPAAADATADPTAAAAVVQAADAVTAELVGDGALPAELGEDLRAALDEVLAEMPDAAGMSDAEVRQLFSEIALDAAPAS